jgi:hypothetical protein
MALAILYSLGGCGPMQMPMAPRFKDEEQKQIDAAWDKALVPVDRLDRRRWLDIFVGGHVYEGGVDKLAFRSEKRFAGGLVVMEVTFDRLEPVNDLFRVEVFDPAGRSVRKESYGREEVEKTYQDLFVSGLPQPPKAGETESPEMARKRAEFDKRWKGIVEYFPKAKEKEKEK